MKTTLKFAFGLLMSLTTIMPLQAKTAREYCPKEITKACLINIAEEMIKAKDGKEEERASYALRVAGSLLYEMPEEAFALAKDYISYFDERELRSLASRFANKANHKHARELFIAAREHRINNPKPENPKDKVPYLLSIAENMAKAGYLDLTRETHTITLKFFPEEIDAQVPFAEEFRVARLMYLYGWPEDTKPWFEALYERVSEIPEHSTTRGFTLTKFIKLATLIGDEALTMRVKADLLTFYENAPSDAIENVHLSEVGALAEAGLIEEAKAAAQKYGIAMDDALRGYATLFLSEEVAYVPSIFPDSLRRYEGMISALETSQVKELYIAALVLNLKVKDRPEELEQMLPRVTNKDVRADIILKSARYYTQYGEKPDKAADLILKEYEYFSSLPPNSDLQVQRLPISFTAIGLWEIGDIERAVILSDLSLKLWKQDQSEERIFNYGLVKTLSKFSQEEAIEKWLQASVRLFDQCFILVSAFEGAIEVGDYERGLAYFEQAEVLVLNLPKDTANNVEALSTNYRTPYGTLFTRQFALFTLKASKMILVQKYAEKNDLTSAKRVWEGIGVEKHDYWKTRLALAEAEVRAGNPEVLEKEKYLILDELLSGKISSFSTGNVISGLNP